MTKVILKNGWITIVIKRNSIYQRNVKIVFVGK